MRPDRYGGGPGGYGGAWGGPGGPPGGQWGPPSGGNVNLRSRNNLQEHTSFAVVFVG